MRTPNRSLLPRIALFYGAVLLLTAVAIHGSAEPALATDCVAVDSNGQLRDCTAMELYGQCLTNAVDSFDQCVEGAGFIETVGCNLAWVVDYYACAALLPASFVIQLVG